MKQSKPEDASARVAIESLMLADVGDMVWADRKRGSRGECITLTKRRTLPSPATNDNLATRVVDHHSEGQASWGADKAMGGLTGHGSAAVSSGA